MSHIPSSLTHHDSLYQSVAVPALSSSHSAAAKSPRAVSDTNAAAPAIRASLRAALRLLLAVLRTWRARRRARRELAAVDARTLRDIGIDPGLVAYEISQPFWCPLRDWRA